MYMCFISTCHIKQPLYIYVFHQYMSYKAAFVYIYVFHQYMSYKAAFVYICVSSVYDI